MIKNKVKRQGKTDIIFDGVTMQKYAWACIPCGRIYKLRGQAEKCIHADVFGRFGKLNIGKIEPENEI